MSLKLKTRDSFKARVTAKLATDNPDRMQDVTFIAEYKHMPRAEFRRYADEKISDEEWIEKVLLGVGEIADESGAPVSLEVARAAIIDDLALSRATVQTFMQNLTGTREKN